MSKERYNQIIEEVYENYKTVHKHAIRTEGNRNKLAMESLEKQLIYTQKDFINKIKTDEELSEKWGLKIEERELSLEERKIYMSQYSNHRIYPEWDEKFLNEKGIPTKLITVTYNDKTIESYESKN
jgi:hypothetical protein